MKCIHLNIRRAVTGRWFLIAVMATLASLWLSIGSESYYLFDELDMGYEPDWQGILTGALTGQLGMLALPALSALPFAAQALHELRSGAARSAIFRTGRRAYVMGQVAACAVSGMLLQLAASLALVGLLTIMALLAGASGVPVDSVGATLPALLNRMLCAGLWACAGSMVALVTQTASAAYIAPLCLCYTLMMIGTRFFPALTALNPITWPQLTGWLLPCLTALMLGLAAVTLTKEVRKYV